MDYILRKWEFSDGPSLSVSANDVRVARYLRDFFPFPYTEEDALGFITYCRNTADELEYNRAIIIDGKAAGSISLRFGNDVSRKNAEIGYWLGVPYWGNGIVTDAVSQLVRIGFETFDMHRIFAEVYAPNTASARVLEKNGFIREACLREAVYKNGQYMDLMVYSLLRHG
ncbi:MAG: GNAT family N-acetyltransferase [Lachnospiraceae bacterium]|nr:GNAT family N-acetyltransferase [Lachnospiraceae bacterium]